LLNAESISVQSFADAGSSDITRLPILMPIACQGIREGKREERKKGRKGLSSI
jgi:hypothetical protein